ncbi:hypothetical protein ABIC28_005185 [Rhodococcus sp. PvR044]|uniref:hypothetical protein n=1 Tax=Rhodococcus sp. PvR044 TaxID=3156402 RepID=UPI00339ADC0C
MGTTPSDSNAGRVRAITASVEKSPLGDNLWTVKVNNGTRGPITELEVDVFVVDDHGNRTADECGPAKGRLSIPHVFESMLGQALQGGLGAIANQAQGYAGMPTGGLASLSSYGRPMASHLLSSPQGAALLGQVQASMADSFPRVVTAEQRAEVVYFAEGTGEVHADIAFDDEDGNRWLRPFGQPPKRVE